MKKPEKLSRKAIIKLKPSKRGGQDVLRFRQQRRRARKITPKALHSIRNFISTLQQKYPYTLDHRLRKRIDKDNSVFQERLATEFVLKLFSEKLDIQEAEKKALHKLFESIELTYASKEEARSAIKLPDNIRRELVSQVNITTIGRLGHQIDEMDKHTNNIAYAFPVSQVSHTFVWSLAHCKNIMDILFKEKTVS